MPYAKLNRALLVSLVGACRTVEQPGGDVPDPTHCLIGAPAEAGLDSEPTFKPGDTTGFVTITACGDVTQSVVLGANLSGLGGCLKVVADDVVIDGGGYRIDVSFDPSSNNQNAVYGFGRSNLTVRNVQSNGGIQLMNYGTGSSGHLFENNDLGGVALYSITDVMIRNNRLGNMVIADTSARISVMHNAIEGAGQHVIDIVGDYSACPVMAQNVFEYNTITNTKAAVDSYSIAMYLRCSANNTFRNNTFRGIGQAGSVFLRDVARGNLFEHNTFWTDASERGAIVFADGSATLDDAFDNTFRYNIIRGDQSRGVWLHATIHGNRFERNLFWTGAAAGNEISAHDTNTYDHNTFFNSTENEAILFLNMEAPGVAFSNNIVSYAGAAMFRFDHFVTFDGYGGDYNLFQNRTGPLDFASTTSDLPAWQTASGDDAHSLVGDPVFVDPAAGDFRLGSPSAALGRASDGTDIGAYPASCN